MLTPLVGSDAIIVLAVGGCIINLLLVPTALVLLSLGGGAKDDKEDKNQKDGKGASQAKPAVSAIVLKSLKQPIVWAPVGGLALVLCGLHVPNPVLGPVEYLGKTAGPVALFTSGIVLQSEKPVVSLPVVVTTLARNLVIPGLAFLLLTLLHVDQELRKTVVLALALPAAALQTTLALQYKTQERENASYLLYSNLLSVATITAMMLLLK